MTGFTPEEQVNIATFGTETARAQYNVYGLTGREEVLIQRYFRIPGARVVDLGCGYGRTTVPLQQKGFRVLGLDVVPRMIEEARRSHPDVGWALGSATDLPLPDESVDYVLFSANGLDCIHPLLRRERALAEIRRVLRPGGCAVYSSHNWAAQIVSSAYHPTRRRQLWRNLRHGRFRPGYLRIAQGEGELVLYYGTPAAEVRRLRRLGFRSVALHAGKISPRLEGRSMLLTAMFDAWPHYVAHR